MIVYSSVFQENVLCFKVAMKDSSFVQVVNCEYDLDKPFQNLILREIFSFSTLYPSVHIAALAMNHDDVEELFTIKERVFVSDNICVSQFLQQSNLFY